MSGAEAGLILAILPLCVTALEHHRDELRPFKSLFRYHKEIQRSAEDLGVAYVGFVQTIHLIFEEAGVADPDRLDRMVTSLDPSVWTDQTLESRLMDYFGKIVYEKRYRVVVRRIFDSIKDIAGILGYEIKGGGDTDIGKLWHSVQQQQRSTPTPKGGPSGHSSLDVSEQLKARAKYFIKAGQLGLKLEDLERNIQRLSETAEKAQKLSTAAPPTPKGGVQLGQRIKAAQDHVGRLYRAITTIKSCQSHPTHCLSLRLDSPKVSKSAGDNKSDATQDDGGDSKFVVAFAPEESSETWSLVEIQVVTTQPEPANRKVAFALPGPTLDPCRWLPVQDSLCARLQSRSKSSMRIDPFLRLQERIYDTGDPQSDPAAAKRLSLKGLLKTQQGSDTGLVTITTESALRLGYTLALAFVQLYATPWMTDDWCTDEVVFLRSPTSSDIDPVYIPVTVHQQQASHPPKRGMSSAADMARRLLGLAVILLELCTKRPIEECRRDQHQNAFGALEQFTIVRRHYRDKSLVTEPPCFQEVIKYCLECYSLGLDLDLDDPGIFQQVVDKVVAPIQRDLKSCVSFSGSKCA